MQTSVAYICFRCIDIIIIYEIEKLQHKQCLSISSADKIGSILGQGLKSKINHSPAQTNTMSSSNAASLNNHQQKQPEDYLYTLATHTIR